MEKIKVVRIIRNSTIIIMTLFLIILTGTMWALLLLIGLDIEEHHKIEDD